MKKFEEKLFPPDQEWLSSIYEDMDEVFDSFEFLTHYIKARFPHLSDAEIENYRNSFLIEEVMVKFRDRKKYPELSLKVGFGENKIIVFIPDDPKFSKEDRANLTREYIGYYGRMIKESHVRLMALLWSLIPEKVKKRIEKEIKDKSS